MSHPPHNHSRSPALTTEPHPLPLRVVVTAAVSLALLALAAYPPHESLVTAVADPVPESWLEPLVVLSAEAGLLLLVAAAGCLAVWSWRRERALFWRLGSAGLGVITAYGISESVKLVVAAARPCQAMDIAPVLDCPGTGDWSWPSNHAVLAAAFATACVLTVVRTAWFVVPVALLVAAARVAAGVHYVHDVLAGLALGILLVTASVVVSRPVLDRFLTRSAPMVRRGDDGDLGTAATPGTERTR